MHACTFSKKSFPALHFPLLAIAFLCTTNTIWADWPAFRGPNRDGVVNQKLPTSWTQTENIVWRTELPGEGWSSPILVGKEAFMTVAVPMPDGGLDLRLIGVDTDTGAVNIITRLFKQPADAPKIHKKNSHASPTPLYDGTNVYVHFGHQGTACVSPQGLIQWKNDSLAYPPVHGNGGSPTIVGELLVFSRDGGDIAEVTALNKKSGEVVWQTKREVEVARQFSFCTPLVTEINGVQQLILPGSNVVQSLNPQTGQEIWRLQYEGYSVIPRPIFHQGLVFVCTGYNRPSLLAIDPTGSGDVTDTHLVWSSKDSIPHTPSLLPYQDKIALVSDRGVASCFDAKTGEQVWKKRIGGNFSASPLLSGSLMYLLSETGNCTILDIAGEPEIVETNELGERCLASLAVVGDDLLLRSDKALYRIRPAK